MESPFAESRDSRELDTRESVCRDDVAFRAGELEVAAVAVEVAAEEVDASVDRRKRGARGAGIAVDLAALTPWTLSEVGVDL